MELRQLLSFITIVEKGSFNKSAQHLGYSQSSITTHIKELESELGNQLFDRLGKKVMLTHFGTQFFPYASQMIQLYNESLTIDEEPKGLLTIGISESLTICRLPPLLIEFKEKYPKVKLKIKSLENYDVAQVLQSGEIDIALLLEREDWGHPNLKIEELVKEQMMFIRPNDMALPKTALYSDLRCSYKSVFDEYIEITQMEIEESLEFQSIESINHCVKHGLGVSLVPKFSVKEELQNGLFEGIEVTHDQSSIATYLAIHKDKWISASIRGMMESIQEHAKRWNMQ